MTSLTEPEQAFLLARVLANLGRGLFAVDRLAPSAIEALLSAAARLVDPTYGAGSLDEDYLAAHARRVSRALPWLGRGPIEEAARMYATSPRIDVADFGTSVRLTATRAAAIVAEAFTEQASPLRSAARGRARRRAGRCSRQRRRDRPGFYRGSGSASRRALCDGASASCEAGRVRSSVSRSGMNDIARSASAVMVSDGLTPGLAETAEPSIT